MALFPSLCLLLALQAPPQDARAAFEGAAASIEALDSSDLVYGRRRESFVQQEKKVLFALLDRADPLPELIELRRHPDPRVRCLVLAALYDREDPSLLPHMVELADDPGAAIGMYEPFALLPSDAPQREPIRTASVGQWARLYVDHYLMLADWKHGIAGYREQLGFAQYWAERAQRRWCASWLLVRLVRSYGAQYPYPEGATPRIRRVRALVDALPPADRDLTLLWLATNQRLGPALIPELASEEELVAAARRLGRDKLLGLLARQVPSDDPDLRHEPSSSSSRAYPLAQVAHFALAHAGELFEPADAERILELERAEELRSRDRDGSLRSPRWAIAAATLDRARAAEHLRAGFERFAERYDGFDRGELLVTWWRLLGSAGDAELARRFHALSGVSPDEAQQGWLLEALAADGGPRAHEALAAIVRHPGFETLPWTPLVRLLRLLDGWLEPDLVGDEELREARHPFGQRALAPEWIERATREHPRETQALRELLEAWRTRVRESLPRWEGAPAPK